VLPCSAGQDDADCDYKTGGVTIRMVSRMLNVRFDRASKARSAPAQRANDRRERVIDARTTSITRNAENLFRCCPRARTKTLLLIVANRQNIDRHSH
jgi:hypothetical protein